MAAFPGALVSETEAHGRSLRLAGFLSSLPSSACRTASEAHRSTGGKVWPPDPPPSSEPSQPPHPTSATPGGRFHRPAATRSAFPTAGQAPRVAGSQ